MLSVELSGALPVPDAALSSLYDGSRLCARMPQATARTHRAAAEPRSRAVCRVDVPVMYQQAARLSTAEIKLLRAGEDYRHEIELCLDSHVIVTCFDSEPQMWERREGAAKFRMEWAPGAALFVPARTHLWIRRDSRIISDILLVMIDPTALRTLKNVNFDTAGIQFRPHFSLDDQAISNTLATIKDDVERPGPGGRLYRESLIIQLLIRLVQVASNFEVLNGNSNAKGGLAGWQLRKVLGLIDSDLAKSPSLKQLGSAVRVSGRHFCRAFRQSVGVPPHRYMVQRRIERAKELMRDPRLRLTDIALSTGFGDASTFSRSFRRFTGLASRAYRKLV
jgi:AraC-like DNA-binding protein